MLKQRTKSFSCLFILFSCLIGSIGAVEANPVFQNSLKNTCTGKFVVSRSQTNPEGGADEDIRQMDEHEQISYLKKERARAKIYLSIAILAALTAIIMMLLEMRVSGKAKKNIKMLTELNSQINEQKEKLKIAVAELEHKDKDKTRILRSVAHDVMNPIAAIAALTEILLSESQGYSEEHIEILKLVEEACSNSLNLSRDILEAAARINPVEMQKSPTDVNALINNTVELLNFSAIAKRQQLVLFLPDEPIIACINKDKMWRVVNNLIANALKFSFEGAVIEIKMERTGDNFHVMVKDEGVGIPDKNKDKIFDMFTEAKRPGTLGEKPYGLGLSISSQIVQAHEGKIWFESEQGKGTTFHVSIPLGQVN